ncbi:PP2C family protein-serine/threonine phosphatase [Cellulomonas carbonis]|nr:SpoIIE family protein phosphatase [Cellulomonas carbonis]
MTSTVGGQVRADLAEHVTALWCAPGLGVLVGEADRLLDANAAFLGLVGLTADEVVARGWRALLPEDRVHHDEVAFKQLTAADGATFATELVGPDDTRVPVLASVRVLDPDSRRWVAAVVDLSRESQLRRMAETEAAIVATLLADAPFGFALVSPDLRFLRVNAELAAMNGFTVAEHEGRPVFELLPELREDAEPLLRHVLETGEAIRDVEIVGTTPADPGTEHVWRESFFPVRAPGRPAVGVAAVARDETELHRLRAELERVSDQRRVALEEVQRTLLPTELPVVPGLDLAARYMPASEELRLGGDWYDAVVRADALLVAIGDAVGHGVHAVGLMARTSVALTAYLAEGHRPDVVLHRLDGLLQRGDASRPDDGGTVASALVAEVDTVTGTVTYAAAGHPYALLRSADGRVRRLGAAQGPLLGARSPSSYPCATALLEPGGALLLYTDGLVERRDESLTAGIDRLAATVARSRGSAEALVAAAVADCLGGREREDDVCLLAVVRPA